MSNLDKALAAACVVGLMVGLAACHEPVSVTVYEPGEYKGAADPLLKQHATSAQKETLQQRFAMGQSDR